MEEFYEIDSPGEGEYTDRKSRFIGHALPVRSEEEAMVLIDQIKRKYCHTPGTAFSGSFHNCDRTTNR